MCDTSHSLVVEISKTGKTARPAIPVIRQYCTVLYVLLKELYCNQYIFHNMDFIQSTVNSDTI